MGDMRDDLIKDLQEAISYLQKLKDVYAEKPLEELGGEDIHAHLGKLGIARNIIDGIGMDLKEMMEKKI